MIAKPPGSYSDWYCYTSAEGDPIGAVTRIQAGSDKTFRQWHWNGGGWAPGKPERRVLYRLKDIEEAKARGRRVYVVEGEKDADRLASLGHYATTNLGGAGKWRDEDTQYLSGVSLVCLVPDMDDAGIRHALSVFDALTSAGIRVVWRVPTKGKDVSSHLDNGGQLARLSHRAPSAKPKPKAKTESRGNPSLRKVIDRLKALDCQPVLSDEKRQQWEARCPSHDDSSPSLSIAPGETRPVVLICHAGCTIADVAEALGMNRKLFSQGRKPDRPTEIEGIRHALSDLGNAKRFIEDHKGNMFYAEGIGWLAWNGKRLVPDSNQSYAYTYASATAERIAAEAERVKDLEDKGRVQKWCLRSQSGRSIETIVRLVSKRRGEMLIRAEELDSRPDLLVCRNGTVELRTGKLRASSAADLNTRMCGTAYDSRADVAPWVEFLRELFPGDPELIMWLKRALGYTLTGEVTEQVFFLLHGSGENGKSTMVDVLMRMLGDYGHSAREETFAPDRFSSASNAVSSDLAQMRGKRFVSVPETSENARLARSLVKRVSSGDLVEGRRLREETFTYSPTFKLFMMTNHLPIIGAHESAMWRRIRAVPFEQRFDLATRDTTKARKLLGSMPGILRWCVEGAREWYADGLGMCRTVNRTVEDYRLKMDSIAAWLKDDPLVSEDEGERAEAGRLYARYVEWCADDHRSPLTPTAFGKSLTERGHDPVKLNGIRYRLGIGMKAQ